MAGTVVRSDSGRRAYREVFTACPAGSCRYGPHRVCLTDYGCRLSRFPKEGVTGDREIGRPAPVSPARCRALPIGHAIDLLWRIACKVHLRSVHCCLPPGPTVLLPLRSKSPARQCVGTEETVPVGRREALPALESNSAPSTPYQHSSWRDAGELFPRNGSPHLIHTLLRANKPAHAL